MNFRSMMEILGHPVEGTVTFHDFIMLCKLKSQSDVNYTWEQSFLSLKKSVSKICSNQVHFHQ